MKIERIQLPPGSALSKLSYDYADSYRGFFKKGAIQLDPLSAGKIFFSASPQWVETLFTLRNRVVAKLGLKTGEAGKTREQLLMAFRGQPGERMGLFEVFDRTESELILGEDDRHLNFRVSLYIDSPDQTTQSLTISTIVVFNNWIGKLYFLPVKTFHKLIVPAMLRGMMKKIQSL